MTDKPKRVRRKKTPLTAPEQIARGMRAQREWRETDEAFLDVRDDLLEAIAGTAIADADVRERLYSAIWVLGRTRDLLMARINDGAFAEASEKAMRDITAGQTLN